MKKRDVFLLLLVIGALLMGLPAGSTAQGGEEARYRITLKSRQFTPTSGVEPSLAQELTEAGDGRWHVILQFEDIPTDEQRATLEASGIKLLAYLPNFAWFASLPAQTSLQASALSQVRWMGAIQAADRTSPFLREHGVSPDMLDAQGRVKLDVHFFADITSDEALRVLSTHGAAIETELADFHRFIVRADPSAIAALAEEDGVQWIAEAAPPKTTLNDTIRARTNVDDVHGSPHHRTGRGVTLGIWDGGSVDTHADFGGRLTIADGATVHSHATHVAGTMAGDGYNSLNQGGSAFQWKGMAPGADIISYDWNSNLVEHDSAINTYGIALSQNSWGYTVDEALYNNCYLYGDYHTSSADHDAIVTGLYGKRIPIVFAAGNERNDGDCGMTSDPPYVNYANLLSPGTAKNVIAVGATNAADDSMTDYSSWGPTDDGRTKPDVVAPGGDAAVPIMSTTTGDTYGGMYGTSMAAPTVSGIIGLLIEGYVATFGTDPLPSTMKALLVQTAVDLDDGTSYYNPGPDYASGYGRVDAQAAMDELIAQHLREDHVLHSNTRVFTVTVPASTPALTVTLAWDDEPGAVNANPALVNDLDLTLVQPDGTTTHLPWVLDPANPSNDATTGADHINNVEQVVVNSPVAGTWEIRVAGTTVPVGPQWFSLVAPVTIYGNASPAIAGLPDQWLLMNDSADNAIDLWAYASDPETLDGDLSFAIDNTPDPNAGVSIDASRYIDINPAPDWTGQTDVTIRVTDLDGLYDVDTFQVTVIEPALPTFCDGFESGSLSNHWLTDTTFEGRVQVSSTYPYSGTYSVLLDDDTMISSFSTAAIILTVDLSGQSDVDLDFWWRDFLDEDDAADGVFFSDDWGSTWISATNFIGNQSIFKNEVLDLAAIATANGLTLNDHFQIKFQFYDNYPIPSDGYAIDQVCVVVPALPDIELSPTFFDETVYQDEIVTKTLTISNTGTASLTFNISETAGGPVLAESIKVVAAEDIPWLSEDPISGTVSAGDSLDVDVILNATGLDPGDYSAEIVINNNDPDEDPMTVPVTMHVLSPNAPAPGTISPDWGYSGQVVHITNLAGAHFESGATVKLTRSGEADIVATNVSVVSATQITCDFDLTGVALGQWTVVVTNPDSQFGDSVDAFGVKAPVFLPIVLKNLP